MGKIKTPTEPVEPTPRPVYLAVVGLNFNITVDNPVGIRVEAGEPVPASVGTPAAWLIEQGLVKEAENV